jgi:AcrR family transcriptional regulator
VTESHPIHRARDPDRKNKIVQAVADLIAERGYSALSMNEIGDRVGISGAAIYRHFANKSSLLVAVFDRSIDELLEDERLNREKFSDPLVALTHLVARQVDFVVDEREFARVYHGEADQLPDEARLRLRRKQRAYLREWESLLHAVRPELDDAEARAVVHAAIGAAQSPLFHRLEVSPRRLKDLLCEVVYAALGLTSLNAGRAMEISPPQ